MNRLQSLIIDTRRKWGLMLLALPGLAFLIVFYYFPLYGLVLPFKNFSYQKGLLKSDWFGFKNFEFFFKSQDAIIIVRNTVLLNLLFIFSSLLLSVICALCLYELSRKAVKIYQTAVFLPHFLSWVVVSYITYGFLKSENGIVAQLINVFGGNSVDFYMSPQYWPFIYLFIYVWKTLGNSTIIYYAVLMSIDDSYFEAAAIDGASRFQQIKYISFPMLIPMMVMLTILSIGRVFFADFGMFYFIGGDSPFLRSTTDVIDTYVFRALRVTGDIGMSSAVNMFQAVVGFIMIFISNYIARKISKENSIF